MHTCDTRQCRVLSRCLRHLTITASGPGWSMQGPPVSKAKSIAPKGEGKGPDDPASIGALPTCSGFT